MLLVLILLVQACLTFANTNYNDNRAQIIKSEESQMLGSTIVLNEKEIKANEILMHYKTKEFDDSLKNSRLFLPSRHFFETREAIQKNEVFKILQRMPKGGALHGHDIALVSQEYLYNLTYKENLYACKADERLKLKFLRHAKSDQSCPWVLLATLRQEDPSYNAWVRSQLTLNVKNPKQKYRDINEVWNAFNDISATAIPLITYRPVFEEFFYQALKELYEDNVSYLEFRGTLPNVYELDGTEYGPMEVMELYDSIVKIFNNNYPDFIGAKFIYAPQRSANNHTVEEYIKILKRLKSDYPNFLAGFDLVGQEDKGRPLIDFIDHLKAVPKNIDFYFHAGETNWYGTSTDDNLIDAVLMGSKRIGHGFALVKHPEVLKIVKEKNIAIEVCPLSNQVLLLVDDMRNHPASYLIASGFPVVISYDDPTYWSAKGLSYNFYMAFVGISGRNSDLRLLKQLAINSIQYSSLSATEKNSGMILWENKWNEFINLLITNDSYNSARSKYINRTECFTHFPRKSSSKTKVQRQKHPKTNR